jgi:hypothetical protein
MSSKLMDYFNKQPRLGTLSTSSKDGKVNSAYFGSPYMVDEKTIIMGLTKNRTLYYLHYGAWKDADRVEGRETLRQDDRLFDGRRKTRKN